MPNATLLEISCCGSYVLVNAVSCVIPAHIGNPDGLYQYSKSYIKRPLKIREKNLILMTMVDKCMSKVLQNASPTGALFNTPDLHKAIIGLEKAHQREPKHFENH